MPQRDRPSNEFDALDQINLDAAGIDVGADEVYVAIPRGRDKETVRSFPTFTVDLQRVADWLEQCHITTIAMESTGVYWIPLFEILESRGFEVCLVNARHLKNVPGRKTDVLDCQWIQQLHTYGLLRASFRPPEEVCALRAIVRQREMLVRYRSSHIQPMQKALQLMNIQLTQVLSDITGVTGMQIIRAIVGGERDARVLAAYRQGGCAHTESEIVKALQGNYRREHLFALRQALELYDLYGLQIQQCDLELEALYHDLGSPSEPKTPANQAPQPHTTKRRKNQAHFDLATSLYRVAGVDLTRIDGIDALTAQVVLSETGLDMNKWPTDKHFTSWLGLCPQNEVTGGKVKRRGTAKTKNRANTALRVAAQTLWRSDSALGAFFRRMRAKHGPAIAVTATAHKLARIIYHMLKYRTDYIDPGTQEYETQQRERVLRNRTDRLHGWVSRLRRPSLPQFLSSTEIRSCSGSQRIRIQGIRTSCSTASALCSGPEDGRPDGGTLSLCPTGMVPRARWRLAALWTQPRHTARVGPVVEVGVDSHDLRLISLGEVATRLNAAHADMPPVRERWSPRTGKASPPVHVCEQDRCTMFSLACGK